MTDALLPVYVVVAIACCVIAVAVLGRVLGLWKKNSRPARVLKGLLKLCSVALSLAGAYLVFFTLAWRFFETIKVLDVWEDKRAVWLQLAKEAIPQALIIIITAVLLLWRITEWGRCPHCNNFPVRRTIDEATNSSTWSCRKYPQEHHGPVGKRWWSKPQVNSPSP